MPQHRTRNALAHLVGSRIKELRVGRGWSERELAARLSLPPRYIKLYEAGKILPKSHTLYRLGLVFDTSAGTFLDEPTRTAGDTQYFRLFLRLESLEPGMRRVVSEFLEAFTMGLERLKVLGTEALDKD